MPTAPRGLPVIRRIRVVCQIVLAVGLTVGLTSPALAATTGPRHDSSTDVQRRADRVSAKADRLQRRLDVAVANYQAALNGLASSVNASVASDRVASESQQAAADAAAQRVSQIRALYMSGGSLGVFGSVLNAQSPTDLADRMMFASSVLNLSETNRQAAVATAQQAQVTATQRLVAARRQIATVGQVEAAARHMQQLVARTKAVAAQLTNRADQLAAKERVAAAAAAAAAAAGQAASSVKAGGIPVNYLRWYRDAAATCPMPWVVLAAIGQVESGHGSNMGPSSSGAEGPMQFLPSTFAAYAVDGDGDGVTNIWNPADAIYSAANYLCVNGASKQPAGLYSAIYRYNHADWYVQMVMSVAGQLAQRFGEPIPTAVRG